MPAHHFLGQPQLSADLPHLVLEEFPQRLEKLEREPLRQAADVVVGLDRDRRAATGRQRFDHIGVQSALDQESDVGPTASGLLLEDLDEGVPDSPPLLLGIGDAGQPFEERIGRIHDAKVDAQMASEGGLHLLPLMQAKETMVDEYAGESVAHGPVHQHGRDRGVDASRQSADDTARRPNRLANPRHLAFDEVTRRPVRSAAAHLEQEVAL